MNKPINDKFRFEAYVTLKKRLGEYDAIAEMNELAVRKFLHDISGSEYSSVESASVAHKIRVNYDRNLDHKEFAARRSQFYILSVYQQAEQFFDDLVNGLPQGLQWKTTKGDARGDDEAQLSWILRMIKKHVTSKLSTELLALIEIFHYFRLIRNAFMHEGTETRELKSALKKLPLTINDVKRDDATGFPLLVPNSYNKLEFTDFLYFTRIVKEIGQRVCTILKPDLNSLLLHTFTKDQHHGLRQYVGNSQRFAAATSTILERKFNLAPDEIEYAIPVIKGLI